MPRVSCYLKAAAPSAMNGRVDGAFGGVLERGASSEGWPSNPGELVLFLGKQAQRGA